MIVGFEDNNDFFELRIKEGDIKPPHTGYRKGNYILLNKETFQQWFNAIKKDDFVRMRNIINSVLDFDSYLLETSSQQIKLIKP